MEEKKTIFSYIGQAFTIFGITTLILCILSLLFGEDGKDISSLFQLGTNGLTLKTLFEFLGVSIAITLLRFLFFTDVIIKRMSILLRTASMIICVIGILAVCIRLFKWFPVDNILAWLMFFISFGICFAVSLAVTSIKERIENKNLNDALLRLKENYKNESN